MPLKEVLLRDVTTTLARTLTVREARVVPSAATLALTGGAARISVAMLYSDLADSTKLASEFDSRIAARVAQAFMAICSRVVRRHRGEIRSFDGDRVLAVFVGTSKCSSAAKAALQINWAFSHVLRPRLEAKYPSLRDQFTLGHCTGVDSGEVLAVRGGIINNNDLVWIGRAPNVAAKLSSIRNAPYYSYITPAVYASIAEDVRRSAGGELMWEEQTWPRGPVTEIYGSAWTWEP